MNKYQFDEELFRANFRAKEADEHNSDSCRLFHVPDNCFKLFPYKAAAKKNAPVVYDLTETISGFFRKALNISSEVIDYDELCSRMLDKIEVENEEDRIVFKDIILSLFFRNGSFQANNIGLYPYQASSINPSAERIALFLHSVMGLDANDRERIQQAKKSHPFNVLERMVVDSIEAKTEPNPQDGYGYYPIKRSIQKSFKEDFHYMLESGMTSVDDLSNLLAFYYFFYVSQTVITLDQFGVGNHEKLESLFFALDWEKVSKNRQCCIEGWDSLSAKIDRMFYHAITLEILNQNQEQMMDYIDFFRCASQDEEQDLEMAIEIAKAEETYTSYIGDYHKFGQIPVVPGANETDASIRHLFECVSAQFIGTDRIRAGQMYAEKFTDFCKTRFVKNRKKSGLVLNLTERDIIFLTKLALRDKDKMRLNELYTQYEKRGVYLDSTSKSLLQEYFTKLNLIDKKSDSGDAQYVKRIL